MKTTGPEDRIKNKLREVRSLTDLEKNKIKGFTSKSSEELKNISYYLTYLNLLEKSRPRYFSYFRGGKAYSLLITQVKDLILNNNFSVETNQNIIKNLAGILPNPSPQDLTKVSKAIMTIDATVTRVLPPKPAQLPRLNTSSASENAPKSILTYEQHLIKEAAAHKPLEKHPDEPKQKSDDKPDPHP